MNTIEQLIWSYDYLFYRIIGFIIAFILIIFTLINNLTKHQQLKTDKAISQYKLQQITMETNFKEEAFEKARKVSKNVAEQISQDLIDNPFWIEKFMDETGATFTGSIYGKRISHFYYEKRVLAKKVVDIIDDKLKNDLLKYKYCLFIDSGTTLYPVFHEICEKMKDEKSMNNWRNNVYIVSNNLPGIQYLMKYCKNPDVSKEYSDLAIHCFHLPGKPLSRYGAVTGEQTENFIKNIRTFLKDEWKFTKNDKIITFLASSYVTCHFEENKCDNKFPVAFYPVARGEGHVEIKMELIDNSDSVYLISPLLKFSFATKDVLNCINGFDVKRGDSDAKKRPQCVEYEEVPIDKDKCYFVTTSRENGDHFKRFSDSLLSMLKTLYDNSAHDSHVIIIDDFSLTRWIGDFNQIEKEIPHEKLRKKYLKEYEQGTHMIWDRDWVQNYRKKMKKKFPNKN